MRPTTARRTVWGVVTFLSTAVGAYAVFLVATGFDFVPDDIADNAFFTPLGLRLHITAAAVAMLTGPWQFNRSLRRRMPRVHRVTGRLYVAGCVVGGVAGGAIALTSSSGLVAGFGFLGLAIAWVSTTVIALRRILARDVEGHERWVMRSFALTFAAVTLRFYLGTSGAAGIEFESSYPVIAWACWVPNLVIVELWMRSRMPRIAPRTAPARTLTPSG